MITRWPSGVKRAKNVSGEVADDFPLLFRY